MSRQVSYKQFVHRMRRADEKFVKLLFQKMLALSLIAEGYAKEIATDYPRVRTGRLRSSITGLFNTKGGNPRLLLRAGGDSGGSPVNYARYVEFGTRYMQPRLFMGRAVDRIQQSGDLEVLQGLLRRALGAN